MLGSGWRRFRGKFTMVTEGRVCMMSETKRCTSRTYICIYSVDHSSDYRDMHKGLAHRASVEIVVVRIFEDLPPELVSPRAGSWHGERCSWNAVLRRDTENRQRDSSAEGDIINAFSRGIIRNTVLELDLCVRHNLQLGILIATSAQSEKINASALVDLGLMLHRKGFGWLMVPLVYSGTMSITRPFSTTFSMLKAARTVAHVIQIDVSAK